MRLPVLSGAGNTFAMLDAFRETPRDLPGLARGAPREGEVDGLLVVGPPRTRGDCTMVLYNRDGSRAEACGNGLRCVALFARERGHVERDSLVVETDCGLRRVRLIRRAGRVVAARARMGPARSIERDVELALARHLVRATLVDVGNPHCVLFVDDVHRAPLATIGRELETHPRFPNRTNVEFVQVRAPGLDVRVWERGVGETGACGTGATAAALAAVLAGSAEWPVEVRLPGGTLTVRRVGGDDGELELEGPCVDLERDVRVETEQETTTTWN